MTIILIGLAIAAAVVARETVVFVPAAVNAGLAFWSNGVIANFGRDPENAPSWAVLGSMVTAVGSLILLIAAAIIG